MDFKIGICGNNFRSIVLVSCTKDWDEHYNTDCSYEQCECVGRIAKG